MHSIFAEKLLCQCSYVLLSFLFINTDTGPEADLLLCSDFDVETKSFRAKTGTGREWWLHEPVYLLLDSGLILLIKTHLSVPSVQTPDQT